MSGFQRYRDPKTALGLFDEEKRKLDELKKQREETIAHWKKLGLYNPIIEKNIDPIKIVTVDYAKIYYKCKYKEDE